MKIGVAGAAGSFSHQAAERYRHEHTLRDVEMLFLLDADGVLRALHERTIDMGVVPVRNSLTGNVEMTAAAFAKFGKPSELAQLRLPIRHHLLMRKGGDITAIRRILSHIQPLRQCARTLAQQFPGIPQDEVQDQSQAAADLAAGRYEETTAVLGTEAAAALHDLSLVAHDLQDDPHNTTTFAILAAIPSEQLSTLRFKIDDIDRRIIELLAERDEVVKQIRAWKQHHGLPVIHTAREEEVLRQTAQLASALRLSPDYIRSLFQRIIAHARDLQKKEM